MKTGTSLYLDLVRFSAAAIVFLQHLHEHSRRSFAFFWERHLYWSSHLFFYSQTAVIVFFVLSGYVIAHVLVTRERTPLDFAASRLARLYSVVLPALLLTWTTNYLEELRYPGSFQVFDGLGVAGGALHYLGTALFFGQYWLWPELDPPNTPFWSLSVEATIYLAIAFFVFAPGRWRLPSLALLSLAAGPTIVLLAPTWLIGYGAYQASRHRSLRPALASVLWLASALLLCLCPLIEEHFRQRLPFLRMPDHTLGEVLASYAAAIFFAVNILALDGLARSAERILGPIAPLVRWLGSMTFALYLFHQPLLSLFSVYGLPDRSSPQQMLLLAGGTLLIVATIGRLCEQSKGLYKRGFLSLWRRLLPRTAQPAVAVD